MLQDKKEIGRRIRLIRTGLGINQKEFGERLGVATSSVSAYEKGETSPSFEVVATIAKLGNISIDDLLTGGPEDAPPIPDLYDWAKAEEEEKGIVPTVAAPSEPEGKAPPSLPEVRDALRKIFSFAEFVEGSFSKGQGGAPAPTLTAEESRLLDAFRKLDKKRRERLLEDAEDRVLAMSNRGPAHNG